MPADHIASSSPVTSPIIPGKVAKIDTSALGAGLSKLGQGTMVRRKKEAELAKQAKEKADNLWVRQKALEGQKFMTQYMVAEEQNPTMESFEKGMKAWDTWVDDAMRSAPSQQAGDNAALSFGGIEVTAAPKLANLSGRARTTHANNQVRQMVGDAHDMTALSMDPDVLAASIGQVSDAITEMTGTLYTPDQASGMVDKATQELQLGAVDLWMNEDPKLARGVLASVKGISASVRAGYEKRITATETSTRSVDRTLMTRDFESHLSSLTLDGTSNYTKAEKEAFVNSFPAEQRVGKMTTLNDEEYVAKGQFSFKQSILGKSASDIDAELAGMKPSDGTDRHHKDMQLFKAAQTMASAAKELIRTDPFTAAGSSPGVTTMREAYLATPKDERTPAMEQELISVNKAEQLRMGVPLGSVKYSDTETLKTVAGELNAGDSQSVITRINQLSSLYGQYYPDIFRNLVELPSGSRVSSRLAIVNDSLVDDQAPSWVHEFIDSKSLKPMTDLGYDEDQIELFNQLAAKGSMVDVRSSMIGSGGITGTERAAELRTATAHYAMVIASQNPDYNEKKSVRVAQERMLDANFGFASWNGVAAAIPIRQVARDGKRYNISPDAMQNIDRNLDDLISNRDVMTGLVEWSQWSFDPDATADFKEQVTWDTVRENAFWALNAQDNGVELKTRMTGTGQTVTVRGNDFEGKKGAPITVLFEDILEYDNGRTRPALSKTFGASL